MSFNGTKTDGVPFAHGDDDIEHDIETDAKGIAHKLFGSSKKRITVEQTDAVTDQRIPRYKPSRNVASGGFRGVAVIINNENFQRSTGMNQRMGTKADEKHLKRLFGKLDFDVKPYTDVTTAQIRQIVENTASIDHSNYDCFFMVFLSHGENGLIYGTDGTIEVKPLTERFVGKSCPSLIGKPKVFIFQACRGRQHEEPVVHADEDTVDGIDNEVVVDAGVSPTLPNASDFLFCYSVTEGFFSHRDTLYGSWYIQCFVEVFEEELINRGRESAANQDILSLLTFVNYKVAEKSVERTRNPEALGKKQMPCFLSMLTKKFYLVTKE